MIIIITTTTGSAKNELRIIYIVFIHRLVRLQIVPLLNRKKMQKSAVSPFLQTNRVDQTL